MEFEKLENGMKESDVELFFRKWSENCRIFTNYKPIHSHEDMLRFADDFHKSQLKKVKDVNKKHCPKCGSSKVTMFTADMDMCQKKKCQYQWYV